MFAELHPAGTVCELTTICSGGHLYLPSVDHRNGCDVALPRESDKDDLEKETTKTAVDRKSHLLTDGLMVSLPVHGILTNVCLTSRNAFCHRTWNTVF